MPGLFGPRIAALFGVAFAVLLFLAVAMLKFPAESTDQEVLDWWAKDSNQVTTLISMTCVAFAAFAFALFITFLRDRLNAAAPNTGNPMYAVGLGFAALMLVSAGVRGAIGNALGADEPMPGVDTLRYIPEVALTLMEVGVMAAGVCILLASWAVKKSGAFAGWFAWTGFVTGALTMLGAVAIGAFVIPVVLVWALAGSVAVWRSGGVAPSPALRHASAPA